MAGMGTARIYTGPPVQLPPDFGIPSTVSPAADPEPDKAVKKGFGVTLLSWLGVLKCSRWWTAKPVVEKMDPATEEMVKKKRMEETKTALKECVYMLDRKVGELEAQMMNTEYAKTKNKKASDVAQFRALMARKHEVTSTRDRMNRMMLGIDQSYDALVVRAAVSKAAQAMKQFTESAKMGDNEIDSMAEAFREAGQMMTEIEGDTKDAASQMSLGIGGYSGADVEITDAELEAELESLESQAIESTLTSRPGSYSMVKAPAVRPIPSTSTVPVKQPQPVKTLKPALVAE